MDGVPSSRTFFPITFETEVPFIFFHGADIDDLFDGPCENFLREETRPDCPDAQWVHVLFSKQFTECS